MRLVRLLCTLVLLLLPAIVVITTTSVFAQTGKIVGVITEAATGETMPGVNVVIEGIMQGAVTDAGGFYFINNVRPGTYTLRASFVGFTPEVVENVRVSTGLTTEINIALQEEVVGLEEVTVTFERPIVRLDVSANVAILEPAEFENLPLADVRKVLDLQAGIEPGLQIRGGGLDEVAFIVDGMNLRTGRSNDPITTVSYTSLEEVQVQTGGFNAEYGNVRAGLVNVTTKEPPRRRYTFDGIFRFAPAQDKALNALHRLPAHCDYSGTMTRDCDSWFIRPALDPAVAFDGTDNWDPYTQRQYKEFEGWNAIAERLRNDEGFDVTAEDLIEYFKFTHRKDNTIDIPDYEVDFTLGGPLIPGVSERLGDLRFLFSYRGSQTAYMLPQGRDAFTENIFQGKLVSNIARGVKLTLHGMSGTERGVNSFTFRSDVLPWRGDLPSYPWQSDFVEPLIDIRRGGGFVFSDAVLTLANIDHALVGASFTHALSAKTFYEVHVQRLSSKYRSKFPNLRDGSFIDEDGHFVPVLYTDNLGRPTGMGEVTCFGGTSDLTGDGMTTPYCVGDEPLGFAGIEGTLLSGESMGGDRWNRSRDTTDVSVFTGRFDLTNQVNRFLQIKTGAELIVSDYDWRSGRVPAGRFAEDFTLARNPIQGAAYAQGKLEFEGMIANLGLRLDYFDANMKWWVFDDPYDRALSRRVDELDARLPKEDVETQLYVSPRLGVSFPITENSKLYFNYGHFRQMLRSFHISGVSQSTAVDFVGNPDHPMPLTAAYELGYDQNLFDLFLLRISGFYRDVREQSREVRYEGLGALVEYRTIEPWNYADVRGAEFTLTKNRGKWIRGFVNFTFLQPKRGDFGYSNFFENSFKMRDFLRTDTGYRLKAPLAEPFSRMSLILITPEDFGPEASGVRPLADWRVSLLGEWRSGQRWVWDGLGRAGIAFPNLQENVAWRDFWNFDLRLTKQIKTRFGSAQLFIDIDNVFNRRHLYQWTGFPVGAQDDFLYYMQSLHLQADTFDDLIGVAPDVPYKEKESLPYIWVPGHDRPGDFRKPGVAFQPIEAVVSLDVVSALNQIAWYWARDTGTYSRWNGEVWESVPEDELQQVLDDKAYIDMPNLRFNTFLNPRRFTFGIRVRL